MDIIKRIKESMTSANTILLEDNKSLLFNVNKKNHNISVEVRGQGYANILAILSGKNNGNITANKIYEISRIIYNEEEDTEYDYSLTEEIDKIKNNPFYSYSETDTGLSIDTEYDNICFQYSIRYSYDDFERCILKINRNISSAVMARCLDIFMED